MSDTPYGLIGEHLSHSFSKELHGMLGNYPYSLTELPPEALSEYMTRRPFAGINVTIPYKQDVIPFLEETDPAAAQIGAVNTVINRGGRLSGYNTDIDGLTALLRRILKRNTLKGKKVLILGTGGTSRTALAACRRLGAGEVYRVSRTAREDAISYETACRAHADADFIINATPVGTAGRGDTGLPIDPAAFPRLMGAADVVYHPLRTPFLQRCRRLGIPCEGGLYMLVAQAVRANEYFFDRKNPPDLLADTYRKLLWQKENIILIGMPASGKSTVGRILAKRLGREFFDADTELVRETGRKIPEIFRTDGEPFFRELERQTVARLSEKNGVVIATGGGAVLDPRNVDALRQNGRIFWLDRPPQLLKPTASRPTASDRAAILQRYTERYDLYRAAADIRIDSSGDIMRSVSHILVTLGIIYGKKNIRKR